VIKEALKVMKEDECRLIRLSTDMEAQPPRAGLVDLPMTCFSGGTMEIYIEPQQPRPRLLIVGTLPVARALAQLGKAMNYHVLAMDLEGDTLPDAHEYVPSLAEVGNYVTPSTFVVVATHGNYDEAALEHLLRLNVGYIGLVSSRRRAESVREYLHDQGFDDEALGVLKAPAGLDIQARRGDEIALSIMAEIVQRRRSHEGVEIELDGIDRETESGKQKAETATTNAPHDGIAIDPICQMEVEIATAKYQSHYGGQNYYFCCAGCKRTFDANPTTYLPTPLLQIQFHTPTIAIDPICQMEVDVATAKYRTDHKGTTYYFCCAGCKRTFKANPASYIKAPLQ
jgi:xanthine dehydrogenase accessory factor